MIKRVVVAGLLLLVTVVLCIHDYPLFPTIDETYGDFPKEKQIDFKFPMTGIYRSEDHGATWNLIEKIAPPSYGLYGSRRVTFHKSADLFSDVCKGTCPYSMMASWLPTNGFSQFILFAVNDYFGVAIDGIGESRLHVLTKQGIIIGEGRYWIPFQNYGLSYYKFWSFRPLVHTSPQPTPSLPQLVLLLFMVGMWLPPLPLIHALLLHIVYRYADERRSTKYAMLFSLPPIIFCCVRFVSLPSSPPFILLDLAKECALCALLSGALGAYILWRRSHSKAEAPNLILWSGLLALPVPLIMVFTLWWGSLLLWIVTLFYLVMRRGWTRYYEKSGLHLNKWAIDSAFVSVILCSTIIAFLAVIVGNLNREHLTVYENVRLSFQASPTAVFIGFALLIFLLFIASMIARPADLRKKNKQKLPRRVAHALYLNVVWLTLSVGMGLLLVAQWHWIASQSDHVMRAILAYYFGV
jgi:hypothetical protein